MPYNRRPLNPLTPFVNQVVVESNAVNENFNILAQAFVSDNPETHKVKEADTVDGFHASLTPAPFTLVPLDTNGILDLSSTYIRSNVYTFRRIDLTNATSDYELQVGEEAIINFTDVRSVPLRIATGSNRLYEMYMYKSSSVSINSVILPNNTTYASSFSWVTITWYSDTSTPHYFAENNTNLFKLRTFSLSVVYAIIDTTSRIIQGFSGHKIAHITRYSVFTSAWYSNLADWTSLGTLDFSTTTTGYVLIRRLA